MTCTCRHHHAHSVHRLADAAWATTCSCCDWAQIHPTSAKAFEAGRAHHNDPGGQLLDTPVKP